MQTGLVVTLLDSAAADGFLTELPMVPSSSSPTSHRHCWPCAAALSLPHCCCCPFSS